MSSQIHPELACSPWAHCSRRQINAITSRPYPVPSSSFLLFIFSFSRCALTSLIFSLSSLSNPVLPIRSLWIRPHPLQPSAFSFWSFSSFFFLKSFSFPFFFFVIFVGGGVSPFSFCNWFTQTKQFINKEGLLSLPF